MPKNAGGCNIYPYVYIAFYGISSWGVKNEFEIYGWLFSYQEPPPPTGGGEDLTASCLYIRLTPPSQQHSTTNLWEGIFTSRMCSIISLGRARKESQPLIWLHFITPFLSYIFTSRMCSIISLGRAKKES